MSSGGSFLTNLFGGGKKEKGKKISIPFDLGKSQKAPEGAQQDYVPIYMMEPVVGKRNCPVCDSENPPMACYCSICGERI